MPPPITPKSRPSARSAYVALGSSFASGPGIDPLIDPSSSRSGANYPRIVAASLDLALTDVSCGGATVNDIVNGDRSGRPAQIDAVTADAALVTLTVGGNDIQYLPQLIRATYQHQPAPLDAALARIPDDLRRLITPMLCTPVTADDRRATADAVGGLAARLADLLTDIQRRAPRSRVLVVDYLSILPNPAQPVPLPLLDEELAYFTDIAAQLSATTALAARQAGAELVEASTASRDHHAWSPDPWVFGFEFHNILAGGAKAFHPNQAGMAAVASLTIDRLALG